MTRTNFGERRILGPALLAVLLAACGGFGAGTSSGTTVASSSPNITKLGPGPKLTIEMLGEENPNLIADKAVVHSYWTETIPQASDGRITVNYSYWDVRGLHAEAGLRTLRDGLVDLAIMVMSKAATDAPYLEGNDLAGLSPNATQAAKAGTAWATAVNPQLSKLGVQMIGVYAYPAQVIYCKDTLKQLSELKGRRVRVFGHTLGDFVQAAGGQPVSMASSDVYSAMQRGVIDCAISGTSAGNTNRWYEVAHSLYTIPLAWAVLGVFVNQNWWNSQPADVRGFLSTHTGIFTQKMDDLAVQLTQGGVDCNTGKDSCVNGNKVTDHPMVEVKPTAADLAQLKTWLSSVIVPAFFQRCGLDNCKALWNSSVGKIAGITAT